MTDFLPLLHRAASGTALTPEEMTSAFEQLLAGSVDPVQAGAFLTALKVRGETPGEIAAAAMAMRAAAIQIDGVEGAVDTCGTGGDGANTYNISTAVALVLAACGVPVAKHGNRAASSMTGTADVFAELGVNIELSPEKAQACLEEVGLAFLFARNHHPAMKFVAPIRSTLGIRTLFNLLGPLTNPAGARRQLLGVYDEALVRPIAETLKALGSKRAFVVHGDDGLDELTVTGGSHVCVLKDGKIEEWVLTPEDAGLDRHPGEALTGGDAATNAKALREVLEGKKSAYRDAVVLNTAAGLIVSGKEDDIEEAARRAEKAIDSGAAAKKLEALIQYTNS
ncbi:anthranilate phosphoribosyltransferase [Parvularcula sp. LCG005]|uniref:anthranilate phosphoribosyltransferase n=1 Tax=Parvularcula sp. LCG005 TaxID=3078805 RepID=UPI002941CC0B|nr:anthranilate phosphoribosyltransferase [Parvularcula sp. LCG005]WOI52083.1 anthranilate phosphoribosyltransferase [Parvularcula sp. LCG005]